jgi:hypothetical protein
VARFQFAEMTGSRLGKFTQTIAKGGPGGLANLADGKKIVRTFTIGADGVSAVADYKTVDRVGDAAISARIATGVSDVRSGASTLAKRAGESVTNLRQSISKGVSDLKDLREALRFEDLSFSTLDDWMDSGRSRAWTTMDPPDAQALNTGKWERFSGGLRNASASAWAGVQRMGAAAGESIVNVGTSISNLSAAAGRSIDELGTSIKNISMPKIRKTAIADWWQGVTYRADGTQVYRLGGRNAGAAEGLNSVRRANGGKLPSMAQNAMSTERSYTQLQKFSSQIADEAVEAKGIGSRTAAWQRRGRPMTGAEYWSTKNAREAAENAVLKKKYKIYEWFDEATETQKYEMVERMSFNRTGKWERFSDPIAKALKGKWDEAAQGLGTNDGKKFWAYAAGDSLNVGEYFLRSHEEARSDTTSVNTSLYNLKGILRKGGANISKINQLTVFAPALFAVTASYFKAERGQGWTLSTNEIIRVFANTSQQRRLDEQAADARGSTPFTDSNAHATYADLHDRQHNYLALEWRSVAANTTTRILSPLVRDRAAELGALMQSNRMVSGEVNGFDSASVVAFAEASVGGVGGDPSKTPGWFG